MGCCLSVPDDEDVVVTGSVSEVPKVSGTHEFTIRQYSRTKGMGVGKSILSQYFTVDGRTWFIRFYPDGYSSAESDWISFYVQTLYRPQISAVHAEFTFHLLNPNGDVVYSRRSDRACNYDRFCNNWGLRRFITRQQLEAENFAALHADSLTVRCTVQVIKERGKRRAGPQPGPVAVPVPPSCFAENAMRFLVGGRAPFDVEFDVDGEIIGAHRLVVAGQSSWFEGLLYGQGKEAGWGRVNIMDTSPEVFKGVLHYIYHDKLPEEAIKGENADAMTRQLFVAADMYLLERLKKMCASRLCRYINDGTVDDIMELAESHSCEELQQACKNHLARRGLVL